MTLHIQVQLTSLATKASHSENHNKEFAKRTKAGLERELHAQVREVNVDCATISIKCQWTCVYVRLILYKVRVEMCRNTNGPINFVLSFLRKESTNSFQRISSQLIGLYFLTEISCPALAKPTNGKMIGNDFRYQGVVTFTCRKGYTLRGSQQRTCEANKRWTGETTTCSGKAGECGKSRHFHEILVL